MDKLADAVADRLAERMVPERLLTIKEVAELLGVSYRTVATIMARGDLAWLQVEDRRRVEAAEVRRYLDRARAKAES